jgi:hypothetical protein
MKRTIRSLTSEEYEQLINAMERHEGWIFGHEEYIEVKKIIGVHLDRKRSISEFLVEDSSAKTWITKDKAIVLAEEGRLHAIVVRVNNKKYLRPEFHQKPFRQMIC